MGLKLVEICMFFGFFTLFLGVSNAYLSENFYQSSCPDLETIVFNTMKQVVSNEPRMAASILRLHFHDCFVQGCDASVLLVNSSSIVSEQSAIPNKDGSLRGFEVIDAIKANVESCCKATVSCADILTLAARDGVVLQGGPSWRVPLGRRDSRTASITVANKDLPPPFAPLKNLTEIFARQGLTTSEMATLSGAHTIGQARCINFRKHIYNDSNITPSLAASRKAICPATPPNGDNNLAPLDLRTPTRFDNSYYVNLVQKQGLMHSDQELFNGGSTDGQVQRYSVDTSAFFRDFAAAMIKMGNIKPLTGNNGEIRRHCSVVN